MEYGERVKLCYYSVATVSMSWDM